MTTQQPSEPSSHDAQCREFRRLLHIATLLRKQVLEQQELQQGVVIFGGSGAGKPSRTSTHPHQRDRII